MKIKVLKKFKDFKEDVIREPGDIFEVTDERFDEIVNGLKKFEDVEWVKVIKEPEEVIEEPAKKPRGK